MGVHDYKEYPVIRGLLDIPEDEPIFILRAQDVLYPAVLAAYEQLYYAAVRTRHAVEGKGDPGTQPSDEETNFADHIEACYDNGRRWQRRNRDKVKIPD